MSTFANLRFAHGLSLRLSPFTKTNPTYKSNGKSHHKHTKKSIENIQSRISERGVSFTPGGRKQRSKPSRILRASRLSSSVNSRCPVYRQYSIVVGYITYLISSEGYKQLPQCQELPQSTNPACFPNPEMTKQHHAQHPSTHTTNHTQDTELAASHNHTANTARKRTFPYIIFNARTEKDSVNKILTKNKKREGRSVENPHYEKQHSELL